MFAREAHRRGIDWYARWYALQLFDNFILRAAYKIESMKQREQLPFLQ